MRYGGDKAATELITVQVNKIKELHLKAFGIELSWPSKIITQQDNKKMKKEDAIKVGKTLIDLVSKHYGQALSDKMRKYSAVEGHNGSRISWDEQKRRENEE